MAETNTSNIGFEKQIWDAACVLRGNIDASEYKSVVLGLIFLKYISDRFEAKYQELVAEGDGFEEDKDEYTAENIFFVPENARWSVISAAAHTPEIGTVIDEAMRSIEKENKRLKDILPKNFARPELDKRRLGEVVDLFTNIQMIDHGNSKDILGRTYEYCLAKFAEQEGKLAGEFYTPSCVVRTLVEVLQPYNGRVYDPCCGSGGMFVQSSKFIENHGGNIKNISVYGQDSNPTTWKLAQMNLAIRGIEADLGKFSADTFFNDCHPQLKADFIMANPPFNLSGWGQDMDFSEKMFEGIIPKESSDTALTVDDTAVRYWLYAAGDGSVNWENDYAEGIMAIGWDNMGDLMQYSSKEEMRAKMREVYGGTSSYKNQVHATWQFANDIKPGDIIFVKKGRKEIIGRGVVEGEYVYDPTREHYRNTRTVRWTDKGLWEHPEQLAMKTLTDVTPYTDFVKKTLSLFDTKSTDVAIQDEDEEERTYDPYTADDFLHDVFMDEGRYNILKALLLTKKNVILQGAPGVGKTFAAKRLAYSIMGEKDTNRVKIVQFHQSYSYEDFIMGFRPTETGFELKKGVFYEFCRKAAEDDRPYFFIIDEINRGNLSKIFGELFMLIESDKRGVELQLLYADEQFSIPSNVYIIGMMNTADRSLAMLDYALRRRFAFFEMTPAFNSSGFRAYRAKINNPKFDRLIATVEQLNDVIANDDSLGEGFCIGHSYFCTNATVTDDWMKSVVEFELIPLLKEYWFDEAAKVKDWSRTLREVVK